MEKETSKQVEPAHQFYSIDEIVKDPNFIRMVNQNISELKRNRSTRPEPKEGYRYKRDWHDRMSENRTVNASYFLDNIEKIWNKQSSLSSQIRQVIQFVCDKSFQQTIAFYNQQIAPKPETTSHEK